MKEDKLSDLSMQLSVDILKLKLQKVELISNLRR